MRGSLIIVAFFIAGLLLARWGWIPSSLSEGDVSICALMFLVGISIGSDTQALKAIRGQHWKILWVPVATWAGTLVGTALASLLLPSRSLADCLAVGSGFGYYSLSSIFITEYRGAELGTIALAANIIREIITLLGAPLQTGSDLRRRSHYNGHHPARHYPFFRQRVCRDFHLPWLYRGLFRPFLGNFLLQTIRPVHGSS